mmetsp:Transcript_11527/g.30086  ORF Transcript_11527/g.30086 Transcript_11527/m.30086 type:complete len:138 (+) Transcript_11527:342-755(+)
MFGNSGVKIIPPELRVATQRNQLRPIPIQLHDAAIKSPPAEVENQNRLLADLLRGRIRQRRGDRLEDGLGALKTAQQTSGLRGLDGSFIKTRRDAHHTFRRGAGVAVQERQRVVPQLAHHFRGHFRGRNSVRQRRDP